MQNSLTEKEKDIYNFYLKYSRHGMPYTPRKDFTEINSSVIVYLKKLNIFFNKFPHIYPKDFFESPIILHPNEKYPTLDFFITRAAIKTYSLAIKKKQSESPENQLESIRESIHFIAMFCVKNNLTIEDYINHKSRNMPTWMEHYREHRVNPYVLIELSTFDKFKSLQEDEKKIWAGDFFDNLDAFKIRYHNSQKTKTFVREAFTKVKNFLKKDLQLLNQ